MSLSIHPERDGPAVTLRVAGELDAHTAAQFRDAIDEAERSGSAVIVLDLTEVSFIDSMGLVALLMAARHAEREGGALQVRAGSGEARQLLEMTSIDQKLNLID